MKHITAVALIVFLLGLTWAGASLATSFDRDRVAIAQAQAAIEQARAAQEAAIAAQEAAQAAQIASAGQTTISTFQSVLFGMVLAAIIGFAAVFVYLRFFRPATQPVTRIHIPSQHQEPLPDVDPQQALLQQMTQIMLLEMLGRQMERLPQGNRPPEQE